MPDPARAAAERAARTAYGRLLSFVAARSRDLAAAEDALADAFRSALETWPRSGVPSVPEAWLLTTARRRLMNAGRHARVSEAAADTLRLLADEAESRLAGDTFPDERLKLLFICAHPSIDPAIRTPLMLQVVMGLDAVRIASAFLVAPAAMGQRLVRAKTKIRDAAIPFETPDPAELPERLGAVLEAIYAAYGAGWDDAGGADQRARDLAAEALFLARIAAALLPGEAEAHGLVALLASCEARRPARAGPDGGYVPLSQQDTALWSGELIAEAEAHLRSGAALARPGRFQLEAAIQSAHAERRRGAATPWPAIVALYEALLRHAPTVGARVAAAVALGEASGPAPALAALDALSGEATGYQPYWAARAHLEARLGRNEDAAASYGRAVGLCGDAPARAFLAARLRELTAETTVSR